MPLYIENEQKIKKLTDKYGNEEMTRFIYQAKLNVDKYYDSD